MDRLRAGTQRRLDDDVDAQVALVGRARPDPVRLVGDVRVQPPAVGIGVHGDARDPELAQRPEDPDGDLAAVRNEHFGEGWHARRVFSPEG